MNAKVTKHLMSNQITIIFRYVRTYCQIKNFILEVNVDWFLKICDIEAPEIRRLQTL